MKKIQKKLSVVLAVMMVLCMFTALPFSASAAETSEETSAGNKINVTSNVADPVSYDYNAQTKQVVVTYLLKADHMIVNAQKGSQACINKYKGKGFPCIPEKHRLESKPYK